MCAGISERVEMNIFRKIGQNEQKRGELWTLRAIEPYLQKRLQTQAQQLHVGFFQGKATVDIPVHSNSGAGMTQYLGQGLDLKTAFYAPGCEAMSKRVEICLVNAGLPEIFLKFILHNPGLCNW